jgi:hypothetical protein
VHVAGEGRLLVFLADLQRGRPDFYRLVAILREALQGIRRTLRFCCALASDQQAATATATAVAATSPRHVVVGAALMACAHRW